MKYPIKKFDENGNEIYLERSDGYWWKSEYDENGNEIYHEDSHGYWWKKEFDKNGNETYYERSDGYWSKREYNENGKCIYYENSDGWWRKSEYDENGNETYYENSRGEIRGEKKKICLSYYEGKKKLCDKAIIKHNIIPNVNDIIKINENLYVIKRRIFRNTILTEVDFLVQKINSFPKYRED